MKTIRRIIAAPFLFVGVIGIGVGLAIRFGLNDTERLLTAYKEETKKFKETL